MKRRDFLKTGFLAGAALTVLGKAMGLANNAMAAVTFVAAGKLGYKEAATELQLKAGKKCDTCSFYKVDAAGGAGAGQCTLPAMKSAMKSAGVPYVKAAGYCNMWKKKA
jgi:hypothetical protein